MQRVNGRMDLLLRMSFPSASMFRLVKKNGKLLLEKEEKLPGRGYYLLKEKEHIQKARKKKVLERLVSPEEAEKAYRQMEDLL